MLCASLGIAHLPDLAAVGDEKKGMYTLILRILRYTHMLRETLLTRMSAMIM